VCTLTTKKVVGFQARIECTSAAKIPATPMICGGTWTASRGGSPSYSDSSP